MNDLTTHHAPQAPMLSTGIDMLDTEHMARMLEAAKIMATARVTLPKHLQGSAGDCMAIIMQAANWNMNPFSVAQKTHIVNGTLGYEAQLVSAVVSSSSLLKTRISYEWEGDWKAVNGKTDKEDSRAVIVSATIKGESEPRTLRISMAQVGETRNSPLWVSDPRQQLAYLATKRWARLHAPDVLLGVYSVDELQDHEPRDMGSAHVVEEPTTTSRTDTIKARLAAKAKPAEDPVPDLAQILDLIANADSLDALDAVKPLVRRLAKADRDQAVAAGQGRRAELEASASVDEARQPTTESGLTFEKVIKGIELADSQDQIDEWLDLSRSLDLYPEGRATIDQAAEKRLAEISS